MENIYEISLELFITSINLLSRVVKRSKLVGKMIQNKIFKTTEKHLICTILQNENIMTLNLDTMA